MNSELGLSVQLVWSDGDMHEFRFCARSKAFFGATSCYVELNAAEVLASSWAGFPSSPSDERRGEYGGENLRGHGEALLSLSCADGLGHLYVVAQIYHAAHSWEGRHQTALVEFKTTPASVDEFVSQLRAPAFQQGTPALLRAIE